MKILNAIPGFGAPLSEREIKDFLSTQVLNVLLGTVDENGDANVHPAWYYYDIQNEKIYVETGKQSKKMDNIRKSKGIYFCIDDPTLPYKGVRGKASVKVHEDVDFNVSIVEKMHYRYLGTLDHPISRELISAVKKGQSIVLEISPNKAFNSHQRSPVFPLVLTHFDILQSDYSSILVILCIKCKEMKTPECKPVSGHIDGFIVRTGLLMQ